MTLKLEVSIFSVVAAVAAVSATLMITASTLGLTDLVTAQGPAKFGFNLTGNEEVPPVQTNATAMAEISAYTVAGDSITYSVKAMNIKDITAGHIHLGKQGENGPIVVTMFKYDSPMNQVAEQGSITADKLEGPMAGKQLSDLATAMSNGETYANVHTEQNPNGEIRGQIISSSGQ